VGVVGMAGGGEAVGLAGSANCVRSSARGGTAAGWAGTFGTSTFGSSAFAVTTFGSAAFASAALAVTLGGNGFGCGGLVASFTAPAAVARNPATAFGPPPWVVT
jgi:hypothetical protein